MCILCSSLQMGEGGRARGVGERCASPQEKKGRELRASFRFEWGVLCWGGRRVLPAPFKNPLPPNEENNAQQQRPPNSGGKRASKRRKTSTESTQTTTEYKSICVFCFIRKQEWNNEGKRGKFVVFLPFLLSRSRTATSFFLPTLSLSRSKLSLSLSLSPSLSPSLSLSPG